MLRGANSAWHQSLENDLANVYAKGIDGYPKQSDAVVSIRCKQNNLGGAQMMQKHKQDSGMGFIQSWDN